MVTGTMIAALIWIWATTWRKDTRDLAKLDRHIANGEHLLAVFWHGKFFSLFALASGRRAMVVTERSFRGEVIGCICWWYGYQAVKIRRGKDEHPLDFVEGSLASQPALAAMAVDGPVGPYHQPKSGAVRISADLGYRIVPISVDGHPKRVIAKRWDKHELPLPFARVKFVVGEPIDIPRDIEAEQFSHWQNVIREQLLAADKDAQGLQEAVERPRIS
jgi:lysophospholipid acyltransferase (LPLAT)-like uncharacterized protein